MTVRERATPKSSLTARSLGPQVVAPAEQVHIEFVELLPSRAAEVCSTGKILFSESERFSNH